MDGFVYQITNPDYLWPFMVSVASLREHNADPVLVVLSKDCWHLERQLADIDRPPTPYAIVRSTFDLSHMHRQGHYRHKFLTYRKSLAWFSRSIFLDCDTIVHGSVGELFTDGLTLCKLDSGHVNCGVLSFGRNSSIFMQLCIEHIQGREFSVNNLFMHDEQAFNELAPLFEFVEYVDDRYCRCNEPHSNRLDWKVRHLHNQEFLNDPEWNAAREAIVRDWRPSQRHKLPDWNTGRFRIPIKRERESIA